MMTDASAPDMEHMWRRLPEEILVSNVLPRLPMASLCRFRVVCKEWNALPTQSDFAARHALACPAKEFVLITFAEDFILTSLRSMHPAFSFRAWNFLDVGNSRVFPHVVKVIPVPLSKWFHGEPHVMFTDPVSMEYEILRIYPVEHHYKTKYMDIYESKTGKWRRVTNTTSVPASPGSWYQKSKFVKLKNTLHQIFSRRINFGDDMPYLMEFDKTTGVSSILDFPESFIGINECMGAHILELVVSLSRLFCVYRPRREEDQNGEHDNDYLEVFEVLPEQHEWESLVRMPKPLLHWIDGNDFNSYLDLEDGFIPFIPLQGDVVEPIGCASSILFCSGVVGRFVAYDLASKTWHQFSHGCPPYSHRLPSLYIPHTNFSMILCPP